ncbi:MAG: type II toxin-antitoxin system VapC family toxin [Chloroflexi bacterium]|nr:type II toxin-antitoxin system VapC family toxin [Chloroflexota bacterium]
MSRYLIDTDWAVDVLSGQEAAAKALLKLAPSGLAMSLISYGELYEGAHFSREPQGAVQVLRTFLEGKQLLPLTIAVMERFALVRGSLPKKRRQQIGDMDLLIAATALHHDPNFLPATSSIFSISPVSRFTNLPNSRAAGLGGTRNEIGARRRH